MSENPILERTQRFLVALRHCQVPGIRGHAAAPSGLTLWLPYSPQIVGNPETGVIHGGVIAGFMEHATMLHLLMFMDIPHLPKIIDFSIDYLRAGHYRDSYAQCQV